MTNDFVSITKPFSRVDKGKSTVIESYDRVGYGIWNGGVEKEGFGKLFVRSKIITIMSKHSSRTHETFFIQDVESYFGFADEK